MALFKRFILRYLATEKLRSSVTVFAIALGIAVIIAIQLTNDSSVRGFKRAVEVVAGATSLSITGNGPYIDESKLVDIGWLRKYGHLSPVIEGTAVAEFQGRRNETLRILGIDVLSDRAIRDYKVLAGLDRQDDSRPQEFLKLLLDPQSIVITEKLARAHDLKVGSIIRMVFADRARDLEVSGLLADEGPAKALDGNFAIVDIAAAQLLFDRLGRIDRLDIRLSDKVAIDDAIKSIRENLPAGLNVDRPEGRGREVEKLLEAFHFNLTALSYIALIVGLFLIYNTISISVIGRREEIGTLRALGTTRNRIAAIFLAEAGVLAVAGILSGIVLGRLAATAAINITRSTVDTLYVANAAAPAQLTMRHIVMAFCIGIPLSLLAALIPALEASRVQPIAAIRSADRVGSRFRVKRSALILSAAFFVLAYLLAQRGPVRGIPLFGYGAALAIILGAAFSMPAALFWLNQMARRMLTVVFRISGRLAYANLGGAISRVSISVAALTVSLAMMLAIAILVGSFRKTVIYWIDQTIAADIAIRPATRRNTSIDATLSPDVADVVMNHHQVAAVDRYRNFDIRIDDRPITIGTGDFSVSSKFGSFQFKDPRTREEGNAALVESIGRDAVIASESFAIRFAKKRGDEVTVPTAHGNVAFRIAAVYFDYSNDRGVLIMDRTTMERHFDVTGVTSLAVYLKPGANPDQVRQELLSALPDSSRALMFTNASVRREVLRIFDNTFRITSALELIAIVVAILGVVSTLLALILERKREIAILRLLGANRKQIVRMVLVEALMIGCVSQVTGIVVGLLLSLVLVYVINVQSFGWTIQFSVPLGFVFQSTVLIILTSILSGIIPARAAARIGMLEHADV